MTSHEQRCFNEQISKATCLADEKRVRRRLEEKFDRIAAQPWETRRSALLELERLLSAS